MQHLFSLLCSLSYEQKLVIAALVLSIVLSFGLIMRTIYYVARSIKDMKHASNKKRYLLIALDVNVIMSIIITSVSICLVIAVLVKVTNGTVDLNIAVIGCISLALSIIGFSFIIAEAVIIGIMNAEKSQADDVEKVFWTT